MIDVAVRIDASPSRGLSGGEGPSKVHFETRALAHEEQVRIRIKKKRGTVTPRKVDAAYAKQRSPEHCVM